MFKIGKMFKEKVPSKDYLYIRDIIIKYLNDDNVQKMVSPSSGEFFLINSKEHINICVSDKKIIISNHTYRYEKEFELALVDKLIKIIRDSIEDDRQRLKKSLFHDEIDLLRKIVTL